MPPEIVALILTVLANILLGVIVIARGYRQTYAWYFIGIILSVIVWAIGDALILGSDVAFETVTGKLLFYVAPMFTPAFIWFFSQVFPDGKVSPRLATIGTFGLLASAFTAAVRSDNIATISFHRPLNLVTPHLPGFIFYAAFIGLFFVLAFSVQLKKMRRAKGVTHTQVSYTFYGIIISANIAIFTNIILPLFGLKELIWIGPVCSLIGIISITLAIVRYRLFDIRVAIIRSLAYITSL